MCVCVCCPYASILRWISFYGAIFGGSLCSNSPSLFLSHPIRIRMWNASIEIKKYRTCKMQSKCTAVSFFFVRSMPTFVCFLSLCVFCFAVSFFFFHFSAKIRTVQCTLLYIHCFSSVMYIICLKVTVCSKCSHFQLCYIQCDNNSSNNNKNKRKKKLYYNGCYDNELPRASYSTFDFHTFPFTIFVYLLISDWNIHNECSVADLWI